MRQSASRTNPNKTMTNTATGSGPKRDEIVWTFSCHWRQIPPMSSCELNCFQKRSGCQLVFFTCLTALLLIPLCIAQALEPECALRISVEMTATVERGLYERNETGIAPASERWAGTNSTALCGRNSYLVPGYRTSDPPEVYDLSGEWEILEVEENRTYRATLDRQGNGPYTWQGGQLRTTSFKDRRWRGTWKQTGNDREGEFELVVSEDGTLAKGIWWYVRVGARNNIPPRQHGGSYVWTRLKSSSSPQ